MLLRGCNSRNVRQHNMLPLPENCFTDLEMARTNIYTDESISARSESKAISKSQDIDSYMTHTDCENCMLCRTRQAQKCCDGSEQRKCIQACLESSLSTDNSTLRQSISRPEPQVQILVNILRLAVVILNSCSCNIWRQTTLYPAELIPNGSGTCTTFGKTFVCAAVVGIL